MGKFNATEYKNKFIAEKYERINLTVPKGDKERIRAHAESIGKSVNGYINDLIAEDMRLTQSDPK